MSAYPTILSDWTRLRGFRAKHTHTGNNTDKQTAGTKRKAVDDDPAMAQRFKKSKEEKQIMTKKKKTTDTHAKPAGGASKEKGKATERQPQPKPRPLKPGTQPERADGRDYFDLRQRYR